MQDIKKYYAGIGSRKTPIEFKEVFEDIAKKLVSKNYILRSGGAQGADIFWEIAQRKANGQMEIYLPWHGFNSSSSTKLYSEVNWNLAEKYHPYWNNLSFGAKKLHARNTAQVLGLNNDEPADFVLCWTPGGKPTGGTSQALRIAVAYNIPTYNFGISAHIDDFYKLIETL
jgi:hypothetical protein